MFQLRIRHSSIAKVAKKLGISRVATANALMWPSRFAEEAIAEELGIPVQVLFHERFDAHGNRVCQIRPRKRSRATRRRNVQVQGAA